jgi:hypothetical protein
VGAILQGAQHRPGGHLTTATKRVELVGGPLDGEFKTVRKDWQRTVYPLPARFTWNLSESVRSDTSVLYVRRDEDIWKLEKDDDEVVIELFDFRGYV